MTIQNNAATYNFAHKIYELQRTKIFSKIKIIHNYFEESKEDFAELANRALHLSGCKSSLSQEDSSIIKNYFSLDSVHNDPLLDILSGTL